MAFSLANSPQSEVLMTTFCKSKLDLMSQPACVVSAATGRPSVVVSMLCALAKLAGTSERYE